MWLSSAPALPGSPRIAPRSPRGRRAVVIEGGAYGTTCARVGCMPSKLLIAAADAAHGPERWPEFGLRLEGSLEVDGKAVMARVKRERDRFVGFVLEGVTNIPAADRILGHARFVDDHTLTIDDHTRITFSRASSPPARRPCFRPCCTLRTIALSSTTTSSPGTTCRAPSPSSAPASSASSSVRRCTAWASAWCCWDDWGTVGPFSDPAIQAYARRTFERELDLESNADVRASSATASASRALSRR
jgi:dihydrolipoamide dehydrogenase